MLSAINWKIEYSFAIEILSVARGTVNHLKNKISSLGNWNVLFKIQERQIHISCDMFTKYNIRS